MRELLCHQCKYSCQCIFRVEIVHCCRDLVISHFIEVQVLGFEIAMRGKPLGFNFSTSKQLLISSRIIVNDIF